MVCRPSSLIRPEWPGQAPRCPTGHLTRLGRPSEACCRAGPTWLARLGPRRLRSLDREAPDEASCRPSLPPCSARPSCWEFLTCEYNVQTEIQVNTHCILFRKHQSHAALPPREVLTPQQPQLESSSTRPRQKQTTALKAGYGGPGSVVTSSPPRVPRVPRCTQAVNPAVRDSEQLLTAGPTRRYSFKLRRH